MPVDYKYLHICAGTKEIIMNKIRKAVFPVAGLGTRFLPATKAMPKELMPIIDKPLIQYAVEEAIQAGIDTLIFITGRNKRAIEDHFDNNSELEFALRKKGKDLQADMVRNIVPNHVQCIFVRQPEQLGLGHAVLCAERAVGNEPFAVILADDFILYEGDGVTADLINEYETNEKVQISVAEINNSSISKYGVIVPEENKEVFGVAGLIEKPSFKAAPSNLASIGRYVLTPDIFEILRNQTPGIDGEIQLSDAINTKASQGNVGAVLLNGQRFDCGSVSGYLDAILLMAKNANL
jgi:UTP--glucose-1-phosphate uridylyltransferase